MGNERINLLADLFDDGRKHTLQIAEDVPLTHRLKQLQPGKGTPLWLIGHLARATDTLGLRYVLGEVSILTPEQSLCFAPDIIGGKPPTANAGDYPAWEDVVRLYNATVDRALDGFRELDDTALSTPLPGKMKDEIRKLFPDVGSALCSLIQHDAYHRGQIGMLAKLD